MFAIVLHYMIFLHVYSNRYKNLDLIVYSCIQKFLNFSFASFLLDQVSKKERQLR